MRWIDRAGSETARDEGDCNERKRRREGNDRYCDTGADEPGDRHPSPADARSDYPAKHRIVRQQSDAGQNIGALALLFGGANAIRYRDKEDDR
jgi:hypothetical protein